MYRGKRILVTGASGLVGRQLVALLLDASASVRIVVHQQVPDEFVNDVEVVRGNLVDRETCRSATKDTEFVFHLAGLREINDIRRRGNTGELYRTNILMNTQMLEEARANGVERFLFTSGAGVYPPEIQVCSEDMAWKGPPEPTNRYYAYAKMMGELQCKLYFEEFGMKAAIVRLSNVYGPWDNYNQEYGPPLPSFIVRAVRGEDPFVIWGSGRQVRDFVHSRDVARGMLLALEKYACADPLNLGSGRGTSMNELARLILRLAGREPVIQYDRARPEGRPMRIFDMRKAKEKIGFEPLISLEQGVSESIEWYRAHPGPQSSFDTTGPA